MAEVPDATLLSLPTEVIQRLAYFCPAQDLLALSECCKLLRSTCNFPLVYRICFETQLVSFFNQQGKQDGVRLASEAASRVAKRIDETSRLACWLGYAIAASKLAAVETPATSDVPDPVEQSRWRKRMSNYGVHLVCLQMPELLLPPTDGHTSGQIDGVDDSGVVQGAGIAKEPDLKHAFYLTAEILRDGGRANSGAWNLHGRSNSAQLQNVLNRCRGSTPESSNGPGTPWDELALLMIGAMGTASRSPGPLLPMPVANVGLVGDAPLPLPRLSRIPLAGGATGPAPVPFCPARLQDRLSFEAWYTRHGLALSSPAELEDGEWVGAYCWGMVPHLLDPPMTEMRFRVRPNSSSSSSSSGNAGEDAAAPAATRTTGTTRTATVWRVACDAGTDSVGRFTLDGTIDPHTRQVELTKQYDHNGPTWLWTGMVTPFGIAGVWGSDRSSWGFGTFWIWKASYASED